MIGARIDPKITQLATAQWSMREHASQAVVWQTAINPIIAMELIDNGSWTGSGVLGPEAFEAEPFLDLLAGAYGSPWGQVELSA